MDEQQSAPSQERGFATRAIHGAHYRGPGLGQPIVFPIFQTASFHFDSAEEQEAVNAGREPAFFYSRTSNPTTDALHRVIAELEGAEEAVSFASGMGAISAAILAVVGAEEHIICTQQLYGGTYNLLTRTLPRLGIAHTFVDATDLEVARKNWRRWRSSTVNCFCRARDRHGSTSTAAISSAHAG